MRRFAILLLVLALLAAACNRGDEAETTTTTAGAAQTTTTAAPATTSGNGGNGTTTTASRDEGGVPVWEIIAGDAGTGEYVVLIEPGDYTELDLQNVMEAVVDEFAPVTAHLVDTEDALDLVLKEEPTAEDQELLAVHYYARVVDGTTLEFVGPFAEFESVLIGS